MTANLLSTYCPPALKVSQKPCGLKTQEILKMKSEIYLDEVAEQECCRFNKTEIKTCQCGGVPKIKFFVEYIPILECPFCKSVMIGDYTYHFLFLNGVLIMPGQLDRRLLLTVGWSVRREALCPWLWSVQERGKRTSSRVCHW